MHHELTQKTTNKQTKKNLLTNQRKRMKSLQQHNIQTTKKLAIQNNNFIEKVNKFKAYMRD